MNFLPSALSLTRTLSKGSRLLKRLDQTYSTERGCGMTSLFNLTGKAALVTGGNGGIGLGIVRGLIQAGARVAIVARNTEKSRAAARALAEETGVAPLVLTADVSSPDQVAAVVNEVKKGLGRIDILFNNAGISIRKLPQDLTPQEWHHVMDVNLTGGLLLVQGGVQPLGGELGADAPDGVAVDAQGLGDALVGPAVGAVGVGPQQDGGAPAGVGRVRAGADQPLQRGTLLGG